MFAEFIKSIADLALSGSRPQITPFDKTADHYIRHPDGKIETISGRPKSRNHIVRSLYTLCAFAVREPKSAIWYGPAGVICVCDDSDRRDIVTLNLAYSQPLLQLIAWAKDPGSAWIDQRSMVRQFRTLFAKCVISDYRIVDLLSDIDWELRDTGNSNVGRGTPSLSRATLAKINSTKGAIPERLPLVVPIFSHRVEHSTDITATITCALEINEQQKLFALIPLSGEIEVAIQSGEEQIRQMLVTTIHDSVFAQIAEGREVDEIPIFHGNP